MQYFLLVEGVYVKQTISIFDGLYFLENGIVIVQRTFKDNFHKVSRGHRQCEALYVLSGCHFWVFVNVQDQDWCDPQQYHAALDS